MTYTQEQLENDGYHVPAAPIDDWRTYDAEKPVPRYFDFDWISARHPDLYHAFALSTVGGMRALNEMVDFSGLEVIDIAAGTGRSAIGAARKAKQVTAVDAFGSVAAFGKEKMREAGLSNVTYTQADSAHLPFKDNSFDACINSWAVLDYSEAYRVLRPGGYLVQLGAPLSALCGELTATLADVFPQLILEVAPDDWYAPSCPDQELTLPLNSWNGVPVTPPTIRRDFTYVSNYGDYREAAAIMGRFYGPKARRYIEDRQQSTMAWRLRIEINRVRK